VLKANRITKQYGARLILDGVSFVVNRGECAGIVAPNGAGKTTLLDVMAGVAAADGGSVETGSGETVAYVRQGFAAEGRRTVADVFPAVMDARGTEHRLAMAADALAIAVTDAALVEAQAAYDQALGGASARATDLAGTWRELGLRDITPGEVMGTLSGGEQTKLALLDALTREPDVMLLDEPTNNLDMESAAWLGDRIASFVGAVLLASHDRALLDEHATSIIEIDQRTGRAEVFAGNYSDWAAEKQRRREQQWAMYRRQVDHERRVKQEISDIKNTASKREHLTQNDFYRRKAKKVARRAVVLERRLMRELASGERVEKPRMREYRLKTEIAPLARGGDRMLVAAELRLCVEGRELLRGGALEVGWGERVVIVGANGSGKTTLLRALVGDQPATAGAVTLSPSTTVGYLPQEEVPGGTPGATALSLLREAAPVSETEARRFLHRFLFEGDAAHTPVASLSYGERRRLSLAMLVLSGANLLVLDEPTNHLDIPSREALETALDSYDGAMLAVTHDRYFIERFAQRVLKVEGGHMRLL
jgi:ATP-binding cassette subfamily F protein 3